MIGRFKRENGKRGGLRLLGSWLLLLALLMASCSADTGLLPDPTQTAEPGAQQSRSGEPSQGTNAPQDTGEPGEGGIDGLPVYGVYYYDLTGVVLYLELYGELPANYITKSEARELGWEGGSVENYREGAAIGGDYFGNREGLLPEAGGRRYTECDIDTNGYGSRGSRRLVFSNDGLYFYTSDHYATFSQVIVSENYEVTIA